MGTIVDDAKDYYSDRATRKERKKAGTPHRRRRSRLQTLVDELLADTAFKKRAKDKFLAIHKVLWWMGCPRRHAAQARMASSRRGFNILDKRQRRKRS